MSLYVDSSALIKRYLDEPGSDRAEEFMAADPSLFIARHTIVEIRRNIARLLVNSEADEARGVFQRDIRLFSIIELDEAVCESAAAISELTGVRTLDALHLAAARRIGTGPIPFLTFDLRQAQAARSLGLEVLGV